MKSRSIKFGNIVLFLAILAIFVPFFTPTKSRAQLGFINPTTGEALKITVSPQYPRAFEKVTVTVEDFSRNINGLNISWSINNKVVERGVGLKNIGFNVGALGSVSNLAISIGDTVKNISIRPTEVDLIWQASSYTPPFYQGKALHSNQDPIIVVAEPFFITSQGARVNPNTLTYKWKQNGSVIQNSSGYGRRSLEITPSVLSKPINIEVEATSINGEYAGVGRTTISETQPKVLIYENSPLYGLRTEKALNGGKFVFENKPEATFTAIPFFFSVLQPNDSRINYSWSQNNSSTGQKGNEVVFRAPTQGDGGSASIGVSIKHQTNYLQGATAPFGVEFKKASGTSTDL